MSVNKSNKKKHFYILGIVPVHNASGYFNIMGLNVLVVYIFTNIHWHARRSLIQR